MDVEKVIAEALAKYGLEPMDAKLFAQTTVAELTANGLKVERAGALAAFRAALTPSEETKAAYMGEFSVPLPERDPDTGEEYMRNINVPWTIIKQIMGAIAGFAHAKLDQPQ